ncbi:MAG: hypothetical protein JWM95_722 [Gemmatimonadetes bacterium]|nr:hypothetical protein [Gemmatimonadota bacterium]
MQLAARSHKHDTEQGDLFIGRIEGIGHPTKRLCKRCGEVGGRKCPVVAIKRTTLAIAFTSIKSGCLRHPRESRFPTFMERGIHNEWRATASSRPQVNAPTPPAEYVPAAPSDKH